MLVIALLLGCGPSPAEDACERARRTFEACDDCRYQRVGTSFTGAQVCLDEVSASCESSLEANCTSDELDQVVEWTACAGRGCQFDTCEPLTEGLSADCLDILPFH